MAELWKLAFLAFLPLHVSHLHLLLLFITSLGMSTQVGWYQPLHWKHCTYSWLFFSFLTCIADYPKFLRCLLFTDDRSQLQHSDTSTKPVKRRMLKHQRSYRVDFRWRNPSSPDVVFMMKALFSILEPQNRVERNTYFVFAHDFVLALRYLHFFPLLTYMTDSTKYIWRLLFTDGRSQLQRNDIFT